MDKINQRQSAAVNVRATSATTIHCIAVEQCSSNQRGIRLGLCSSVYPDVFISRVADKRNELSLEF